jgi:hypothetical protein
LTQRFQKVFQAKFTFPPLPVSFVGSGAGNECSHVRVLFLTQQKKKNDKSAANRFVSVPNLSALESSGMGNGHPTRLEPIPNSPAHDVEFNSNKPLPQPLPPKEPKTFLR